MANHKSALKRIRQNIVRRARNRFYHKTARTMIKNFRALTDKSTAEEKLPVISSVIDKLVKRNIIHRNKAANLKSKLAKHVHKLA